MRMRRTLSDKRPTDEQRAIALASLEWETVTRDGKVECPDCAATGYPGGRWTWGHVEHVQCPDCPRVTTVRGLRQHRTIHTRATTAP